MRGVAILWSALYRHLFEDAQQRGFEFSIPAKPIHHTELLENVVFMINSHDNDEQGRMRVPL
jgi:hypothetical protein